MHTIHTNRLHNTLFGQPITQEVSSFCQVMDHWAHTKPDHLSIQFLRRGREQEALTFEQLQQRSRGIAAHLHQTLSPGSRAILMFEQEPDYLCAFLGCLYAGVVAVTAFPPHDSRRNERLRTIVSDCDAEAVLANQKTFKKLAADDVVRERRLTLIDIEDVPKQSNTWQAPNIELDTLAFLQYTSGSTGNPKGVMVNHRSLLSNLELMRQNMGHHADSVFVSWLPLYHDMGLILVALSSMFNGNPLYLMAPEDFVRRPSVWLETLSRYRATVTGAPDFAFRLCCDKIPEPEDHWDLSSMEVLLSGSEPIRFSTVDRFFGQFQCTGLPRRAMRSGYGLAESTVYVSGGPMLERGVKRFDRQGLEAGEARPGSAEGQPLVTCGSLADPFSPDVQIVHPETGTALPEGQVGEVWIASDSNGSGYWGRPKASEETFNAPLPGRDKPYMRTGDLGFILERELYVCGRIKDLIIIRGRNLYPADVCSAAEQAHPALRSRPISAFSCEAEDEERLVIVAALNTDADQAAELWERVRESVLAHCGAPVSGLFIVNNQNLYRTTSGKIQHTRIKTDCEHGRLPTKFAFLEPTLRSHFNRSEESAPRDEGQAPIRPVDIHGTILACLKTLVSTDNLAGNRNLFQLGLDSLKIEQLLAAIENGTGICLRLSEFDEIPTVDQLTREVEIRFHRQLGIDPQSTDQMVELTL